MTNSSSLTQEIPEIYFIIIKEENIKQSEYHHTVVFRGINKLIKHQKSGNISKNIEHMDTYVPEHIQSNSSI